MILLLESLHPEAEALLERAGPVLRAVDPNEPPAELALVRAILTRGRGRIPEALLARCPALAVIARAGAGLDNLDTAAAARRGIAVIHAPGANTPMKSGTSRQKCPRKGRASAITFMWICWCALMRKNCDSKPWSGVGSSASPSTSR